MMNNLILKSNLSKSIFSKFIQKTNKIINVINYKNFSGLITDNQDKTNPEPSVREKVIAKIDFKKIFKKKTFHRNFKVEDTLNQFKSFEERDQEEIGLVKKNLLYNKEYLRVHDDWQKNLLNNKIRKGIIKYNFENYEFPNEQEEKFVVHNIEKTITLPASDEKLFAIIEFKGLQHKVLKDDRLMLEKVDLEIGETFVFDKVLMVASDEYTSIGRPIVSSCKVLAVVEENTRTEKVITFKKKRRKGYQKNMGHRQDVIIVRILKVLHNLPEKILENYETIRNVSI